MLRSAPAGTAVKIAVLVAVVIIYGSLYPFHFNISLDPGDAVMLLRDSWQNGVETHDFMVNVVFYMPLGFCLFRGLTLSTPANILTTLLAAAALSSTLEVAQAYEGSRYSSLWDIAANCTGAASGVVLSEILQRGKKWRLIGRWIARPSIFLLLVSWAGWTLLQGTTACDQRYWLSLQNCAMVYSHVATFLALGLLLQEVVEVRYSRMAPIVLIATVFIVRSMIEKSMPCSSVIAGAGIAAVLWMLVIWKGLRRPLALCLLCAGGVAIERLQPLNFTNLPHGFEWVPFLGIIMAPPQDCIPMALHEIFSLGTMTWLLVRTGMSRRWVISTGTSLLFLVLCVGCFIPGQPSEISDVLVLFGLTWVMTRSGEETVISSHTRVGPNYA